MPLDLCVEHAHDTDVADAPSYAAGAAAGGGGRRGDDFDIESIPSKGAHGTTFSLGRASSAMTVVERYVFTAGAFAVIDARVVATSGARGAVGDAAHTLAATHGQPG